MNISFVFFVFYVYFTNSFKTFFSVCLNKVASPEINSSQIPCLWSTNWAVKADSGSDSVFSFTFLSAWSQNTQESPTWIVKNPDVTVQNEAGTKLGYWTSID